MANLEGVRVVRGPDWKYGDQDGGEGCIGTVSVDEQLSKETSMLRPNMVSVIWDTGVTAQYRAGPQGSYDLRVVESTAMGVKHSGIVCQGCSAEDICGTRWQCETCSVNLCSCCFFKELPHDPGHQHFKRFDDDTTTEPAAVTSWGDDGPQSRVKLMGTYLSAGVIHVGGTQPPSVVVAGYCSPGALSVLKRSNQVKKNEKNCYTLRQINGFFASCKETAKEVTAYYEDTFGGYFDTSNKGESNDQLLVNIPNLEEHCSPERKKIIRCLHTTLAEEYQPPTVEEELAEMESKAMMLFQKAVFQGNLDSTRALSSRFQVVLNGRNAGGLTALMIACQQGHDELVQWLLESGTDREIADNLGYRAIHHAVKRSSPKIVERLIHAGVELNAKTTAGETALDLAIADNLRDCARLLINKGCDINNQDGDGNAPLHRTIIKGFYELFEMLASSGRSKRVLRNKNNLSVLQLAVSMNALKFVDYYLTIDGTDCITKRVSANGFVILSYACQYQKYQVVKLLLDRFKTAGSSSVPTGLEELFEKVNEAGYTLLLVASCFRNCPIIELLVEAGASLKSVDKIGNTAIMILASSKVDFVHPSEEDSPLIFKTQNDAHQDDSVKTLMKNHPILPALIYLLQRGCSWDAANKTGRTASAILVDLGYSKEAIQLLTSEAVKYRRMPAGPGGCMGLDGGCANLAVLRFSCQHKVAVDVCPVCMPVTFAQKRCKCGKDDITSIPEAIIPQQLMKTELGENQSKLDVLKWIDDRSEKGYIEDCYGNKFTWNHRKTAAVGYRCVKMVESDESTLKRCPGVARRYFGTNGKQRSIVLEKPHDHSERGRKSLERPGPTSGGSSQGQGPSGAKRQRTL